MRNKLSFFCSISTSVCKVTRMNRVARIDKTVIDSKSRLCAFVTLGKYFLDGIFFGMQNISQMKLMDAK